MVKETVIIQTDSLQDLNRLFSTFTAKSSVRILIRGEKGLGKTQTIELLKEKYFINNDYVVLEGTPDFQSAPYYPIAEAFSGIIHQAAKGDTFKQSVMDAGFELLRLMPVLGKYANTVAEFYKCKMESPPPVSEAFDVIYQLQKIIGKLSQKHPLIIIFHNIARYDFSSLSVIMALTRSTDRCSYILTIDPTDLSTRSQSEMKRLMEIENHLLIESGFISIELKPFYLQQTREFIQHFLEDHQLNSKQTQAIHERCNGNPLFLKELLLFLLQEGDLAQVNNSYYLKDACTLHELPSSIRNLTRIRIDRLQQELRNIVDVASVLGVEFNSEPIAATLNLENLVILRRLKEIEMVHRLVIELQRSHRFTYQSIHDAVYVALGPNMARELHILIAKFLERHPLSDDNEYALYRHFLQAGDEKEALLHLYNSAYAAREHLSHEEAAKRFRQILCHSSAKKDFSIEKTQQIKFEMAISYYHAGQFSESNSILKNLSITGHTGKVRADALLKLAHSQYFSEDYECPRATLTHLLRDYHEEMGEKDLISSRLLLASLLYHLGRWVSARKQYRKCFRNNGISVDDEMYGQVIKRINMFYIPELALPFLIGAQEKIDKKGYLYWEICHNIGCNHLFLGDMDSAESCFSAAVEYFEHTGSYRAAYPNNNLGILKMIGGKFSEAKAYFEKVKIAPISDFDLISAMCHEGIIETLSGNPNEGAHTFITLLDKLENSSEIILKEILLHNVGWTAHRLGNDGMAMENLVKSIPRRKSPWFDFKVGKRLRLLEKLSKNEEKIPPNHYSFKELVPLENTGRKDAWSYRQLDYEFSELWFWE